METSLTFISEADISQANREHDQQHPEFLHAGRMSGSWKMAGNKVGEVLTDKKIRKYEEAGYYSADFKQARKELWQKKQRRREGNFDLVDGRLIYRP